MNSCSAQIDRLRAALREADAVVVGAGSGMSASAGFTYSGERFDRYFSDFAKKYGIRDMRNLYDGDIRFLREYGFNILK